MIRKTVVLLFLFFFFFHIPCLKAEESEIKDKTVQSDEINVDNFRQKLKTASSKFSIKNKFLKAQIETLSERYVVSPGDSINISVFGEPDLSQREILVKCDGYINVHPLGEIKVAGFNIEEVKDILTAEFKTYFVDPMISVQISGVHAPKFYIYGAIQKPGLYQHYPQDTEGNEISSSIPPTLATVIANAGGIKYNADLEHIQVINTRSGQERTYNLLELIKKGDLSQDIYLSTADKIHVPELKTNAQLSDEDFMLISSSSIAPQEFPIRVIGAVRRPGVHFLTSRSPRLNTAIASSEGYTVDAKNNAVKIHRLTPKGNLSTIIVNPEKNDVVLRPNDIVSVVDKRTTVTGRGFTFFTTIFTTFGRFGSAFNEWAEMFDPTRRYDYIND